MPSESYRQRAEISRFSRNTNDLLREILDELKAIRRIVAGDDPEREDPHA